jgi:hypothetical protein
MRQESAVHAEESGRVDLALTDSRETSSRGRGGYLHCRLVTRGVERSRAYQCRDRLIHPSGGRSWWAHVTFTRLNIGPIIVRNQIEDRIEILELVTSSGAFRTDR